MISFFFGIDVYNVKTVNNTPIKTPAKETIPSTFPSKVFSDNFCSSNNAKNIIKTITGRLKYCRLAKKSYTFFTLSPQEKNTCSVFTVLYTYLRKM